MRLMSEQPMPDPFISRDDSTAAREADFLDRLRREELRVNSAELAGNPFERKSTWRSALRGTGSRGWVAAALAIAVLMLGFHLRPQGSPDVVAASSPDGIVRLTASEPRALRLQIVGELRAAGAQASGYEQLGINGIDADLPLPTPAAVIAVLQKQRIAPPPDGTLRIEISRR
jgi:hypothetical protein